MTTQHRPSVGPQEGTPALDVQLRDKEGKNVSLSDYWQRSPIVLVFLRHFG
jgi:peroxiredoxin